MNEISKIIDDIMEQFNIISLQNIKAKYLSDGEIKLFKLALALLEILHYNN